MAPVKVSDVIRAGIAWNGPPVPRFVEVPQEHYRALLRELGLTMQPSVTLIVRDVPMETVQVRPSVDKHGGLGD